MSNWKDTVMSDDQIREITSVAEGEEDHRAIAQAQAEITYPIAYEEGRKVGRREGRKETWDTAIKAAGEGGKQEGIKEVVEEVYKRFGYLGDIERWYQAKLVSKGG